MTTTEPQKETKSIVLNRHAVLGILRGVKTQIRQIIKPQPEGAGWVDLPNKFKPKSKLLVRETFWGKHDVETGDYGTVYFNGPVLDVGKEFHPGIQYVASPDAFDPPTGESGRGRPYEPYTVAEPGDWWLAPPDDWNGEDQDHSLRGKWLFLPWEADRYTKHSAAQMPLWASRITLEIEEVRSQRLQDITEEDAIAEGVDSISMDAVPRQGTLSRRADFKQLWDKRYARKGLGWDQNPAVWAIKFNRVKES